MTEISSSQQFLSEMELLLNDEKYEDAKALLTQRLDQNQADRQIRLYLLLVNATLRGPVPYEHEIDRLRALLDLSGSEKEIVRRIFLLGFKAAEKEGREKQALAYQRLLRRLLLNQPLDHSIPQSGAIALPTIELPALEATDALPPVRDLKSNWLRRVCLALSSIRKPKPSPQALVVVAAIGLLTVTIPYFLLTQDKGTGEIPNHPTAIPPPPMIGKSVLAVEGIAPSGTSGADTIKREAIQKTVTNQLSSLQQTYDRWSQKNPNLMGSLVVKMKLDAAGNVVKVEDVASRLPDTSFRNAVLDELRKWKFPKAKIGAAEFTVPLLFIPKDMASATIVRWERTLKSPLARPPTALPVNADVGMAKNVENPLTPMTSWNFVSLLIAILLWTISLFLVAEAAKSQQWALGERDGIPESHAGVDMSQLLSCLLVFLWLARGLFLTHPAQNPFHFLSQLLVNPEQLTPGILLAVFPPLIVGMVKLLTALGVTREEIESEVERRNRLWVNSVFISLHVIFAAGTAIFLARSIL
jgi:hypothetical protein